ncbi:MAG: zinc metallopeptidase [Chloroflexi bacterium]|nr:zinc metallopeptidase [Chloroflexota bacterium]MBT3669462.1 zinc metallopeptidase [Chloroflexota bacterium]MBT4003845.1 zinc metallopeptidase [Chloroflexota bacterium]MBT4304519.1 zinc metallopeptidase [Chloroflexota bacterium]MBT4534140.1 zinc metallopeptidase [Chloroflexota bacterium]
MFFSFNYWLFMLPAMILMFATQWYVNSTYKKWNKVKNYRGVSGMEAVQQMIRSAGLYDISVEEVGGKLSDHYDPRKKVLRLSSGVSQGNSVASLAIAAHELGHAQQDQEEYLPLKLRAAMVPMVNIGSYLGWILIFAGLLLNFLNLSYLGLLIFAGGAAFALLTLPVELNASSRARKILTDSGLAVDDEELRGVGSVLNAAALTYVAGLITAILQLLYYASLISGRRR